MKTGDFLDAMSDTVLLNLWKDDKIDRLEKMVKAAYFDGYRDGMGILGEDGIPANHWPDSCAATRLLKEQARNFEDDLCEL